MASTQANRLLSLTTPLPYDQLLITRLRASEGISQLFRYELEIFHEHGEAGNEPFYVDPTKLIGQPMSVRARQVAGDGEIERHFNGIFVRFSHGNRNTLFTSYNAEVVPRVWLLTQIRQSRIFQNKSVSDILREVPQGFEVSWEIQETHEPRNYCVGTFEASDRKRGAAVLDPIDIVTTASANGDITQALKTLPGAQQVGESEGLFVRGGTAAETKTFIDGTLVNNFFFTSVPNIAQFGRFSPFIFKGTVFSTGGYSALYGQALSSALILESIDLPEQSSANLGISVIGGNAGYQHLSKNKQSSFGLSYSYTDLSPAFAVIKQKQDYSKVPAYHNAYANFRVKTSQTGILKYYGYFSSNKLAFTVNSIDSIGYLDKFAVNNTNHFHNLSWKENFPKRWKLNAGLSYTNNKDGINSGMQNSSKNDVVLGNLEAKTFWLDMRGNYFNLKIDSVYLYLFSKCFFILTKKQVGPPYRKYNDISENEVKKRNGIFEHEQIIFTRV